MLLVLASGHWYTSSTLLGVTTVVVGVIAILVGLITWRAGTPRRLLVYSMPVVTPVLPEHSLAPRLANIGVEVTHRGKAVENPHLITLDVESRRRHDISSQDFDQGNALVFDVGAPVITPVDGSSQFSSLFDVISIEGSQVKLEPLLIRHGRVFRLSLLTEGTPHLSCQSPLVDVEIRDLDLEYQYLSKRRIIAFVPVFVSLIAISIFAAIHGQPLPSWVQQLMWILFGANSTSLFLIAKDAHRQLRKYLS